MTSAELTDALRMWYPVTHGWILLPQVRDATGAGSGRTADALAFNAWPSRGLELHGFELKTYRGDWQRELRQPEKAEGIVAYCDRWWIVTPTQAKPIIRDHELPPTWGWMHVGDAGAVSIAKAAPKLEGKPFDRAFVAAVLRRVQACETPEAKIAAAVSAARTDAFEEGRKAERLVQVPGRPQRVIQWQLESLEKLESHAASLLKSIKRDLADVKKAIGDGPAAVDDDTEASA